ncbi:MAG: hypothetical protein E7426_07520 [Ruminococcaceae bacterium]|jgi:hypothetical protein|nr:hypothetical protein [Oscillospiraceae bacterium]
MARNKRYDDDDGRTVADMSGVSRPNLLGFRRMDEAPAQPAAAPQEEPEEDRPWDTSGRFTREERRAYIFGALGASLLIGLAFAVGIAVVILLIGHYLF